MASERQAARGSGSRRRFRLRTLLAIIAAFAFSFGIADMARRRLTRLRGAATLATRENSARRQEAFHLRRAETVRRWAEDWRVEASGHRHYTADARDRCTRLAEYWDGRALAFDARAARSRATAERLAILRHSYLHAASRPWGPPPKGSSANGP